MHLLEFTGQRNNKSQVRDVTSTPHLPTSCRQACVCVCTHVLCVVKCICVCVRVCVCVFTFLALRKANSSPLAHIGEAGGEVRGVEGH